MSANFYTTGPKGVMMGVDLHTFFTIGPMGASVPIPFYPHAVMQTLRLPDERTSTVTADGNSLWKQDAEMHADHLPLPGPLPHPFEAAWFLLVNALSSSQAKLVVHSVKGNGEPLACCVYACAGVNYNCGDLPPARLSDGVMCVTSVKTSPKMRDFLAAVVSTLLDMLFDWIVEKAFHLLEHFKRAEAFAVSQIEKLLEWLFKKLRVLDSNPRVHRYIELIIKKLRELPYEKAWSYLVKATEKIVNWALKKAIEPTLRKLDEFIGKNTTPINGE